VQFECSEPWFAQAYQVAKANLVVLMCDLSPFVGPYLFAGIPEYVQLFGTDTTYSIPGIAASGFHHAAREALRQLGFKAGQQCGRVPHEVTTNGRIFHPGNTQETSQFCIACWDYVKWTGDREFLEWAYPLCQEGVLDYTPAHWDMDLDYYLDGNSMVERPGMGDEKIDSVCYFVRAIFALSEMADLLGYTAERDRYRSIAEDLREAVNVDWWVDDESLFADWLTEDHKPNPELGEYGHWIVAVPMETNVADRDKGRRALQRIEKEWVNEWGMVHTKEKEEVVWTLPTGVLATAEFNYGNADMGTWLLRNIARTTEFKALGTFKELIPEGLSFIQLWSPAIFLQGIIEGIFRIEPQALTDRVTLHRAKLPREWSYARLKQLKVGGHQVTIDLEDARDGVATRTVITHDSGSTALTVVLEVPSSHRIPVNVANGRHIAKKFERDDEGGFLRLEFALDPLDQAEALLSDKEVAVSIRPKATARTSK
jgi:glycogen debranching enzyme